MVKIFYDSDGEKEIIVFLCNLTREQMNKEIQLIIKKIFNFYQNFINEEKIILFIQNILTACTICHQQSFVLPFYLINIINSLTQEKRDLFHSSLLKVFESIFKIEYYSLIEKRATLFAMLIRESVLQPEEILSIIYNNFDYQKRSISSNIEYFTIQLLFFAGDIISAADSKKTKYKNLNSIGLFN